MKNTLPKTIKGVQFKGHIRISKSQLAKLFLNPLFRFNGFIVGNKVNSFHFFGGWHLACKLSGKTSEEMKESINGFLFYLDSELGNNAAIFLDRKAARCSFDPVFVASAPMMLA